MYRGLLPAQFSQPLAEERNATCERCAMLPPAAEPVFAPDEYFAPKVKCCTYHPLLPNYAVGGLLLDETAEGAEGRRRIREKIAQRIGIAPLGILPPGKHRLLYRFGKDGFGRAKALACPYLDQEQGQCTVWAYREAVCATWFCKYNNGRDGLSFWTQLRDYLLGLESVLSAHALHELGWDADEIISALPAKLELSARDLDDEPPDLRTYEELWGDWAGREQEFYERAFEVVRALDRSTFDELGGIRQSLQLERLEKRYEAMTKPALPDPLVKSPTLRVRRGLDGSVVLIGYAGIDSMRVRKPVYELLDYFDGRRTNADVNAAIFQERGVRLSDSLLTKLYQHRILVDAAT
jgi:hypothetical protein